MTNEKSPKISVVTQTIRSEGLKIIAECLDFQSFQDFEWLVGSKFDPRLKQAKWVKDDFTGGFWTFNRISTKLCREAKGEIIVFWQDFIWGGPDTLNKFYINCKTTNGAVSGTGHQYNKVDEYGKPYNRIWEDPRKNSEKVFGSFYECQPNDWEINFGAISKDKLEKVDYFVDRADMIGYGADNVMLAEKLEREGIKFYLDHTCESFTLQHKRERKDWDQFYIMNSDFFKQKKYL